MKIELTKQQYKTFLTMMYCGEWMLNSYKIKEDKLYIQTQELEQYLYAQAKENGLEKWVDCDEETGRFTPSLKMEEDMEVFIEKYNKRQKDLMAGY